MALSDANYVFRFVDIGAFVRRSDCGVFKESEMGMKFESQDMNVPNPAPISDVRPTPLPYVMVGDEAFPLKNYLLRPYPGKQSVDKKKRIFNYRLSRARRVMENTFGILASKWPIFRKAISATEENTVDMVKAAICLHNWLREDDITSRPRVPYVNPESIRQQREDASIQDDVLNGGNSAFRNILRMDTNNSSRDAIKIREEFCSYFNNGGAVPWQQQYM